MSKTYTCAGITLHRRDPHEWSGRSGSISIVLWDQPPWWECHVYRIVRGSPDTLVAVGDRSIQTAAQAIRAAERDLRAIQRAIGRLGL